jgi:peptide/nickel transport system substrate-binding protein
MQQAWNAIGVEATPSLIQFPQLVSQIVDIRTFDVFLVGFNWSVDPDESALFHSRNTVPGGFNGFNFKNDQVDSILDQAIGTLDQSKRKQLYSQFQDIMSDLVPAPILNFTHGIWGVNTRVQGTDFGPFNQYAFRPWNHNVWVTDGK